MQLFRSIFILLLVTFMAGQIQASCGAASCPIDIQTGSQSLEPGAVQFNYSMEYIDQDQPKISRRNAGAGEIRGHHDEQSTLNKIQRLGLEAGLSSRWSAQIILPFIHREHQHIHNHHTGPERETWNFDGVGDLSLITRFSITSPSSGKAQASAIMGGILPTGRDEIVNFEGDAAEVGILPGSGAFSLILGGAVSKTFSAPALNNVQVGLPIFFSSTYQWNETGPDNYKIGNVWQAHAGMTYFLLPKLGLITQVNLRVNRRDNKGNTGEEVQKTGGTYVFASPGFQLNLAANLWSTIMVQIPVYQRVNVIQLTSEYNLLTSISYRFSLL